MSIPIDSCIKLRDSIRWRDIIEVRGGRESGTVECVACVLSSPFEYLYMIVGFFDDVNGCGNKKSLGTSGGKRA